MIYLNDRPNCFLDFDGTLVSNQYRLYQFFINNIPKDHKDVLSANEFWNLKRMGIHEIDWVNHIYHLDLSAEKWNKKKKKEIETIEYLRYDKLFDFTIQALNKLGKSHNLILISRRSKKENLLREIKWLGLIDFFDNIHILPHGSEDKGSIISDYKLSENDMLIGDTEDDFMAGVSLGLRSYMVLSGIRSEWILKKYRVQSKVNIINDIGSLIK